MSTRREIEQALASKTSDELNDFFESLGFGRVKPGGATNEAERRKAILKYRLDLADRRPADMTKICRGLGLPTPDEFLAQTLRRQVSEQAVLSPSASQLLLHLRDRHRQQPGALASYPELAEALHLSIQNVDDAANELQVIGFAQLIQAFGGPEESTVRITDEGRVAASRLADKGLSAPDTSPDSPSRMRRAGAWVGKHTGQVVVVVIAGVVLAILLAWMGLG